MQVLNEASFENAICGKNGIINKDDSMRITQKE
jgi:hypothetical protein